jgi:cobalt/nickel transport system permease protein
MMHAEYIDRYSGLSSPIHRLPTAGKLVAALVAVVFAVALPSSHAAWLAALAGLLVIVAALSRLPWRFLVRRLIFLEPFVLGVAAMSLFQPGGGGLFLLLAARSTLCLLTMILLANTTPFSKLLGVLRMLRVPALLVTTLALMYRYIFVLIDESVRLRRARKSRTFTRGRRRAWKSQATIAAQLFVRSTERAERIYAAMCARGWR